MQDLCHHGVPFARTEAITERGGETGSNPELTVAGPACPGCNLDSSIWALGWRGAVEEGRGWAHVTSCTIQSVSLCHSSWIAVSAVLGGGGGAA